MRKVREILRLKHRFGRSQREIAASLQIAVGTIRGYLSGPRRLSWIDAESLSDVEVQTHLFRSVAHPSARKKALQPQPEPQT